MAARNYQPSLRLKLHFLSKFISRYQALLLAHMTSDEAVALAALQAAIDTMIGLLGTGTGV